MRQDTIFATLWKNLKEEMTAEMNYHFENYRRIKFDEINELYKNKLIRWNSKMTREGAWLSSIENDKVRNEIIAAVSALNLNNKEFKSGSGLNAPLIGLVSGAIVGGISLAIDPSALINTGCFIGGFVLGCIFARNKNNAKLAKEFKMQKDYYLEQIDNDGKNIAEIWGKYDE